MMKTEEKSTNIPRVRIAVLGNINVGKSGKLSPIYYIVNMCVFLHYQVSYCNYIIYTIQKQNVFL